MDTVRDRPIIAVGSTLSYRVLVRDHNVIKEEEKGECNESDSRCSLLVEDVSVRWREVTIRGEERRKEKREKMKADIKTKHRERGWSKLSSAKLPTSERRLYTEDLQNSTRVWTQASTRETKIGLIRKTRNPRGARKEVVLRCPPSDRQKVKADCTPRTCERATSYERKRPRETKMIKYIQNTQFI